VFNSHDSYTKGGRAFDTYLLLFTRCEQSAHSHAARPAHLSIGERHS